MAEKKILVQIKSTLYELKPYKKLRGFDELKIILANKKYKIRGLSD